MKKMFCTIMHGIGRVYETLRFGSGILHWVTFWEGIKVFAILGATGKVGQTTATALREVGVPVRAVVRDRSKANQLAALGCEIAIADLQDAPALARAIDGTCAVQIICPVCAQGANASKEMGRSIESIGKALEAVQAPAVLAISDYGAELDSGTGVTMLFHALEERLRRMASRLIFLRSAEHMENWSRVIKVAVQTSALPSLHHPLTKLFPMVSAFDVGAIAARLLLSPFEDHVSPRIVHVEGPRRYTPLDVAGVVGALLGRKISAYELPRTDWSATLRLGGLSESYTQLVIDLYDAHNAGRIDVQPGVDETCYGKTEFLDALKPLMPSVLG